MPEGSNNGRTLVVKRSAVSIARGRPRIKSLIAFRECLAILTTSIIAREAEPMRLDLGRKDHTCTFIAKKSKNSHRFTTHFKKLCNIAKFSKMTHNISYKYNIVYLLLYWCMVFHSVCFQMVKKYVIRYTKKYTIIYKRVNFLNNICI